MKIFITGGTGFIGRELCHTLAAQGHRLTVLSRRPQRVPVICGRSVEAVDSVAALDPEAGFDAVINLAGEPIVGARWTEERKRVLWDSRVKLTEAIVQYIGDAKSKPEVLVNGSAVGFYGDRGDELLDESAEGRDDFGHALCAAWEQAARKAAVHEVRVCLVRTGLVIDKKGGFLQRMLLPFRLGLGGRIGDGRQWMSWIHRHDLIKMIERLLTSPNFSGVFNGTAPQPVTNEEFTRCLGKLLGRPTLLPMPAWALKLAFGEMAGLLLGGQRVIPKRFLQEGFSFDFETLEKALADVLKD